MLFKGRDQVGVSAIAADLTVYCRYHYQHHHRYQTSNSGPSRPILSASEQPPPHFFRRQTFLCPPGL